MSDDDTKKASEEKQAKKVLDKKPVDKKPEKEKRPINVNVSMPHLPKVQGAQTIIVSGILVLFLLETNMLNKIITISRLAFYGTATVPKVSGTPGVPPSSRSDFPGRFQ